MTRFILVCFFSFAFCFLCNAQSDTTLLSEVIVRSVLVENKPPSLTQLSDSFIQQKSQSQEIPLLLSITPSTVSYSDGGGGVGYSGLRIRGSDLTRLNVTLNGVPVNDAESHGVFFVNLPDLSNASSNISVQRGVGVSAQGSSSFGGSIAINTLPKTNDFRLIASEGYGAFNTLRLSMEVRSGKMKRFQLTGRGTLIHSDGYIDRASSRLFSTSFQAIFKPNRTFESALVVMYGNERTYQAWNGIDREQIQKNRKFNPLGIRSNRMPYFNQTDNYYQLYVQWINNYSLSSQVSLHATSFMTKGAGYYQEFKEGETLGVYGINSGNVRAQDVERQLHLDNILWGQQFLLSAKLGLQHRLVLGISGDWYIGEHFGILLSASKNSSVINHRYYDTPVAKWSLQSFARWTWTPVPQLSLFGDIQLRYIDYRIDGFRKRPHLKHRLHYTFFNPKIGVSYQPSEAHRLSAFLGISHREPIRGDVENSTTSLSQPERVLNAELGYVYGVNGLQLSANAFAMFFHNALLPTGKLNDVGAYTRENVLNSNRLGMEFSYRYRFFPQWELSGSATWSSNMIYNYTHFVDDYTNGGQTSFYYAETPIAFSPNFIKNAQLLWQPFSFLTASITYQFIDQQYLDNTETQEKSLSAYHLVHAQFNFNCMIERIGKLSIGFFFNNVLDAHYEPNGYGYSAFQGGALTHYSYFYPAAEFNMQFSVRLEIGAGKKKY